jgi:hypothetical protein
MAQRAGEATPSTARAHALQGSVAHVDSNAYGFDLYDILSISLHA